MIRIVPLLLLVSIATHLAGMDVPPLPLKKRIVRDMRQQETLANVEAIPQMAVVARSSDDLSIAEGSGQDSTPLHDAVEANNVDAAQALLEEGANVNARLSDGTTPMHIAILNNCEPMITLLLRYKADIFATDNDNTTLLHAAAIAGNYALASFLCHAGLGVNDTNNDGTTALHFAAHNGHVRTVEILTVDHHANLDAVDHQGRTPLYAATLQNHLDVVEQLLSLHADIDRADHEGLTPLHIASWYKQQPIVEALIHAGATVDALSSERNTPLHLAAMNGHFAIAIILAEHGAKTTLRNTDEATPETLLKFAGTQGQAEALHFKAEQYLQIQQTIADIRAGEIDATALKDGLNMLHRAVIGSAVSLVTFLLENHLVAVNFKEQTPRGLTALHYAAQSNNSVMIRLLLAHGANPLIQTDAPIRLRPSELAPARSRAHALLLEAETQASAPIASVSAVVVSTALPTQSPTVDLNASDSENASLPNQNSIIDLNESDSDNE